MRISRALRIVEYVLVVVVGEPLWIQTVCYSPSLCGSARFVGWVSAFAAFALAFHASATASQHARARRLASLAVMAVAIVAMESLIACEFGMLALVVMASQATFVLAWRQIAAFIVILTSILGVLVVPVVGWVGGVSHAIGLLAAQAFAVVAVYVARAASAHAEREAETARELAHANAELRASRALLEETSRAHERVRISRELHDVLGHDLTALKLQLEIATHVTADRAASHIATAQQVAARLLHDVRDVVGAMRDAPAADLAAALRALADGVPGITVHLEMPDELRVDDAARSHCILRCVQEIITNALKHSRAQNLWIAIALSDGATTLDAHDDGCGPGELRPGQGLSGMRARLEEMGGWLRVAAEPSHPFAVSAWLPGKERAA